MSFATLFSGADPRPVLLIGSGPMAAAGPSNEGSVSRLEKR